LLEVVEEISNLIGTGIDKETLVVCMRLIENGVNPTALAQSIMHIKNEALKYS
jgi:hypothetical protein